MRDLKFRAWDKNLKKFHYPDLWDNSMPSNWRYWYELNQWTGLKDKNGIEIYESDYVATHDGVYLIEYDCNELRYYLVRDEGGMTKKYPWYSGKYELKVIGNCYENPELLKGA